MSQTDDVNETDEPLRELLPGGVADVSAGRIGLFITKVRGNRELGHIDDIEVVAVAYDKRARVSYDAVTLEVYNADGELINDRFQGNQSLSQETADLGSGDDKVELNEGDEQVPLPEDGRYVLTWGGEPVAEFNRAELFSRLMKPLEYATTETLALEIGKENRQDIEALRFDVDEPAEEATGKTKPTGTDETEGERSDGFVADDKDLRADANNSGGVNLGVFGHIGKTLLRRLP